MIKTSRWLFAFLCSDAVLILACLLFRDQVIFSLLKIFDSIFGVSFSRYRFLVWPLVLISICAGCSCGRSFLMRVTPSLKKGIVFFELMTLAAVGFVVWQSVDIEVEVDPYWLSSLGIFSYSFELITTAGAGYVLADFLHRLVSVSIKR